MSRMPGIRTAALVAASFASAAAAAAEEPQGGRIPDAASPSPAFTMRFDDNRPAQWWRDVCGIFECHGFRCSLAVNSTLLSESQGACLRELAERGHEIMDHTPSHSIDSIVYPDQASFERASRLPFAHDADPAQRRVFFEWEADDDDARNVTFRAKVVDGELVPAGAFAGKKPPARFFKLPGHPGVFGYKEEEGRFLLRDFWRRTPAETIQLEECDVLGYSGWALHPCDGLLRELASVTRERFDHFGIPRPTVWIFPGGWCGPVRQDAMERVYGGEFGYIGADAQLGPAKSCEGRWFAAYNSMEFFDGDSAATPEELVGKIEARIASGKSHVTLSHMQTRDIQGFLEKTERFAALLEERKVPVLTMGESIESRFGGDGRGKNP